MICSSSNRDRFIVRLLQPERTTESRTFERHGSVVIVPAKVGSGVEHYVHVANASIRVTIGPIKDINMEFRIAQAFKHRAVMTSRFLALVWERKKRP
ncbi:hypothetical protein OEG84_13220 [Hoeflea sp. G2-23]|uniref:Uncharacterized protein n=1 Tax=Hoeflea algicola TaxID=2983763 RepID=A0ABT3ZA31_9HYPH|nr:hypothetical protein [Hoeflea algicola]MCY0148640.1 hypothetical protein [Hoeflea algicola]